MTSESLSSEVVKGLEQGDRQAFEEAFERYSRELTRVADGYLSARVATREDSEDVVQSAFRTFFRRYREGGLRLDSSAQVWKLLVTITVRKAQAKGRKHRAASRDVRAEAGNDDALWLALARDPGPEEAAILTDLIAAALKGLPDAAAEVLLLRLEGNSGKQIAARLGITIRTVQRHLKLIEQQLVGGET